MNEIFKFNKKKKEKKKYYIALYKFVTNHREEKLYLMTLNNFRVTKKRTKILQPDEISSYYLSSCNLASVFACTFIFTIIY